MKICYFGTYRQEYSRNKIMIVALESVGIEVIQCHVPLWHGIQDRIDTATGGWKRPSFWVRLFCAYFKLVIKFLKIGDFDILMLGYPGQLDVFLAKFFALVKNRPLVWDIFMSIYLISKERELDQKDSFSIKMIRYAESQALHLPDLLIQDTKEYVNWFHEEYGISPDRFRLIPTGADDRIFIQKEKKRNDDKCLVLYYGTFIPNHGVMKIMQAAQYLKSETDIVFELIGEGPEKEPAKIFAKEHNLTNVQFIEWVNQTELLDHIAEAAICLGAFGDTPQSLMTVQNKIYECLAMGKPVITGDSPAIQSNLPTNTVISCDREDPHNIASEILRLKRDPLLRSRLSINAEEIFRKHYSIHCLGQQLSIYLTTLLNK